MGISPPRDVSLAGATPLAVRIIEPAAPARGAFLHFHGGGFVFGTPAMADAANSALATHCGLATLSVDYRLAPAHPHPAAVDDGERAAAWLIEQSMARFGTARLQIGGDSVGASLAVLVLLRLRARGLALRFSGAVLNVGSYDFSGTPSQRASTDALFLSPERLRATRGSAFPGLDREALRDPSISALYADLRGLPPALFSVGTNDAVCDDSLFMAARWEQAGNRTELAVYPGATHLFLGEQNEQAGKARARIVAFLNACA